MTKAQDDLRPPEADAATFAPWPLVDRYPIVLGSNLSLTAIANICRLATTGYRQQYVDMLDELLEREPHGYAVLSQRIMTVAGARLEISPAETGNDADKARAQEIADAVSRDLKAIPELVQAFAGLLWAIYYGAAAAEVSWAVDDGRWRPTRLHFIHSRRISYPDPQTWRPHIWDQGMVRGWGGAFQNAPTQGLFGLAIDEYPGKFLLHLPQLRGDYPTRDGLGRELVYWFALKGMTARGAAQYIERFGKPWPVARYATKADGLPRSANDEDVEKADAVMRAMGIGSLAGAVLPDSITMELYGPGQKRGGIGITHDQFIEIINAEISKAVKGQTFTTETGKFGSRSTADVGQSTELRNALYDARALAETLKRDLVYWMVRLNWPDALRLIPMVTIAVEDEPDAPQRLELAAKAAAAGMPVDADALADELGVTLVPNESGLPRTMGPVTPTSLEALAKFALFDPEAALEEDKANKKQMAQALAGAPALNDKPPLPNGKANGAAKDKE